MYWTAAKAAHSAYKFGKAHKDKFGKAGRMASNFARTDPYPYHHRPDNDMNTDDYPRSFPTVPPSLSTGDYGMRGDYAAQDAPGVPRDAPHTLDDVRPYLGLRSRLSQVWINRWTILILLVLARILIAIGSLRDDIDNAQDKAMSACSTVETLGSNMASMPHYLSDGVNELAASGVEKSVAALYGVLFDIVTAVEAIFLFWINMVYGMYECLITFAVTGALHGVVSFADDATKLLNTTLSAIGTDIGKGIDTFNDDLNSFLKSFNSLANVISGGSNAPPKIDLSQQVNQLENVKLSSNVTDDLNKLNSSIPNFDEVKNFTNTVLSSPFEEVKQLMNQSLPQYKFDRSLLPVPERTQLSFCADDSGIPDFFDSLYHVADVARKIFSAVLVLAAVVACFPMGNMEIRRWRSQKAYASRMQTYAVDGIDGVYIASRPWTAWGGIKLGERFGGGRPRNLARWFVAYVTSVPALVLLSLALAGLLSSLCQYAIVKAVEKEVPALSQDVGQFAGKVVDALNEQSAKWANGTNTVINNTNDDLNQHVFGWVNTTTHAVNDTLNTFVDKTISALNQTFGGTILYDPIMGVYQCLIGMKVEAVEKGLTWVSDNAYVEFPMFPADVFSQGAAKAVSSNATTADGQNNSFLADPTDSATDKVTEVVTKLADKLYDGIRTEALLATTLLALYLVLVLMGLGRCLLSMLKDGKSRAEGGPSRAGDIGPGLAEDNARQHQQQPAAPETVEMRDAPRAVPGTPRGANGTPLPPPVYEPPAQGARWPAFGRSARHDDAEDEDEAEQAYQSEKMGFTRSGEPRSLLGHARQSSHGEVFHGRQANEKSFI